MKKLQLLILVIILAVSLAACNQPVATQSSDEDGTQVAFAAPTGAFSDEDMVFLYDGLRYPISSDAALLLDALGSDYEVITAPSCAFDGEDKQFIYSSITIYTYPMDGKDLINEIDITDGGFTTQRSIGLGDTLEDIISAYGEGGFEDGSSYVYALSGDPKDTASPRLYFDLEDGVVVGISYFGANGIVL